MPVILQGNYTTIDCSVQPFLEDYYLQFLFVFFDTKTFTIFLKVSENTIQIPVFPFQKVVCLSVFGVYFSAVPPLFTRLFDHI